MDSRYARLLIALGGLIVILLGAIIVLLITAENDPVAAPTPATTPTTVTTQAPAATEAPPSTETTQPAPETTNTVPPMGIGDVALAADGLISLHSGDRLWIGDSSDSAVATGWVEYAGPDFTQEADGYECGTGDSAGPFGPDAFAALFMEDGLVRIYAFTPELTTADGLGIGSTRAEVEAVLGPPHEEEPDQFYPEDIHLRYRMGDHGLLFVVYDGMVVHVSAGFYEALLLSEGCL